MTPMATARGVMMARNSLRVARNTRHLQDCDSGRMELGEDAYLSYADEFGMDVLEFTSCYQEARYNDVVRADYDLGIQLGVNATPTFFINGVRLIGAQPYSVFAEVIDSELAGQTN